MADASFSLLPAAQPLRRACLTPQRLIAASLIVIVAVIALSIGLTRGGGKNAPPPAPPGPQYYAAAVMLNTSSGTAGFISFTQENSTSPVLVTVDFTSSSLLNPNGNHGLHIHNSTLSRSAPLDSLCVAAGPHFNPTGKLHTCSGLDGHAGDLGNFLFSNGNLPKSSFSTPAISLVPGASNSILYRTVVLHADPDDCGKGGQSDSNATGHSGARLVCAVILPALSGSF